MASLAEIEKSLKQEGKRMEATSNRENKRERVPIGEPRGRLTVEGQEPGFHYAFINDYNVDHAQDSGYEFVTHNVKIGQRHVNRPANSDNSYKVSVPAGGGVTAFLMRIPQEFYEEDMKRMSAKVDITEQSMRKQSGSNGLEGSVKISSNPND